MLLYLNFRWLLRERLAGNCIDLSLVSFDLLVLLGLLQLHESLQSQGLILVDQVFLTLCQGVLFLSQNILDVFNKLDNLHPLGLKMVLELPLVHLVLVLEAEGAPCVLDRHLNSSLASAVTVEVVVALVFRALDFRAVLTEVAEAAGQDHRLRLQAHLGPVCRLAQELLDC